MQISGQDNVSYKIILAFSDQTVLFAFVVVVIGANGYS